MEDKAASKSPPKEDKVDATDSWEMLDAPEAVEDAWDASDTG